MKSPISLLLLIMATPPAAAQITGEPEGAGPRGSSRVAAGEVRYDEVGYAGVGGASGMSAASAGLVPDSFAEVTALDTGRTILVAISGGAADPGQLITLSPAAAKALGVVAPAGVRVRRVTPIPQDASLLATGQAASGRSDAPPVLLVPLRKKLAMMPKSPIKPAARPRPTNASRPRATPPTKVEPAPRSSAPPPAPTGDYVLQIAALSDAGRARALAATVGGRVVPSGALFRVQTGPFADRAAALRGRAAAAKLGYRDAHVIRNPR